MGKDLKPKAKEKLAFRKDTTGDGKSGATMLFGIMFVFHPEGKEEKRITISISDIKKVMEEGFEFTLPEPVNLGNLEDLCPWLDEKLGTNTAGEITEEKIKKLPSPLNSIADSLVNMVFSISRCHIKMAGKKALNGEEGIQQDTWEKDKVKEAVLDWARQNRGKFDTEIPDEGKNDDADIEEKDGKEEWLIFKKEPKISICRAKKENEKLNIYAPTRYTFQVEGRLASGIPLVESLEFDGFAFGVTNEQSKL